MNPRRSRPVAIAYGHREDRRGQTFVPSVLAASRRERPGNCAAEQGDVGGLYRPHPQSPRTCLCKRRPGTS